MQIYIDTKWHKHSKTTVYVGLSFFVAYMAHCWVMASTTFNGLPMCCKVDSTKSLGFCVARVHSAVFVFP